MHNDRTEDETRPRVATWTLALLLLLTPACHDHDHPHPHSHEDGDHSHADDHAHDEGDHAHDEGDHSHDEGDHTHDEGDHTHDEGDPAHGDEHDHDEGDHTHDEGEHDHDEGDPSHGDEHDHDEGDHAHGDEHDHDEGDHAHGDEHSHDDDHAHADGDDHGHDHGDDGDSWAVTVWGDRFEIFAEADLLAAGSTSKSHTHVTDLADFSPVRSGRVAVVLKASNGREQVFEQTKARRDGIFDIQIAPAKAGDFALVFRVETGDGSEDIPAGRVRVAPPGGHHGGLLDDSPSPRIDGEPVPFPKEQQWRTAFATEWVRSGELADSVKGYGDVHPVAGGEVVLTAPIDAVVMAPDSNGPPWPYPGLAVTRGRRVFQLASQIHDEHSLSELEANVRIHESELVLVKANHARFQKLFEAGVISSQQTEETAAEVTEHQAHLDAARDDLASARAARGGTGTAEVLKLTAPWGGQVADVEITPGQAVESGQPLARLVKTDPLWVEVKLRPADAARFSADPAGLHLNLPGLEEPVSFEAGEVRLVSRFPEIDTATGTVGVLLEIPGNREALRLGSAVEAEVLLPSAREGIVIPSSALVDDSGVSVVYVQLDGETFARQEVDVIAEQGGRALVTRLGAGQRLVSLGGSAIRRAVLMTGAEPHGHQH